MKYFQNFPQVNYDVNGDGEFTSMTDFTPGFKVRNANLIKNISYMNHIISDSERPDVTSHMLYGTSAYHWTFFIVNDHLRKGITEWPLGQNELDRYISSKYDNLAVITFDPRVIPDGTYGNLSYVPFTEQYNGSLYLVAYDESEVEVARCMIQTYDTLSCQMILLRDTFDGNGTIDQFVNNYDSYKIISTSEAFHDALNSSYEIEDASGLQYKIAKDEDQTNLNYELMKNATFMFYETVNNETLSISSYDVISSNSYTNVDRITYAEMEETLNNRKRSISVVNPANIARFAQSYFDVLNNG